jgi:hypothetical protein
MKRKHSVFLLLLMVIFAACDNQKADDPNPKFDQKDLFPLSIGKTFNYWLKAYDTSGNETADRRFSQKIEGDTVAKGKTWFKSPDTPTYVSNQPDGLHYYYSFNGEESLIYKYPCEKGDKYESFAYTYKPETGERYVTVTGVKNVEVISTNTSVTSPLSGKKYENCILYRTAKFTPTNTEGIRIYPSEQYVVPGVGAVLIIDYYDEARKNRTSVREQLD